MLFDRKGGFNTEEEVLSTEATNYIMEAFVKDEFTTDELSMFLENQTEVDDAVSNNILMEKTIVRLDKTAKLSKAKKMAIFTIAKEKNDPKFKKLLTVWKMERYLEAELEKKYGNEAGRRAKKVVADSAKKSKGTLIKKAAERAKDSFSSTK
jgi:hypothetical protein